MFDETVEGAKKISKEIVENKKGTTLSKDLINKTFGRKLTTNELALARRVVPFVSEEPVVQEKHEGVRNRVYRPMSENDFEHYDLTDKNFYQLSMEEVNNIRRRIKQVKPDVSAKDLMRYLTICDMFVQAGARDKFTKWRRRYFAYSVNMEVEEYEKQLEFLQYAGILSISTDNGVHYNEVFRDVGTAISHDFHKRKHEERPIDKLYVEAKKQYADIGKFVELVMEDRGRQAQENKELRNKLKAAEEANKKMLATTDNVRVVLASYKRLEASVDKVTDKRVRDYRNLVQERVDSIFASAQGRLTKILIQNREGMRPEELEMQINAWFADTTRSTKTAVKAWGKLKGNDKSDSKK